MREHVDALALKVREVMSKPVDTIDASKSVFDAAKSMKKEKRSCLVVTKMGSPLGIVTERDLVRKVLAEGKDPKRLKISRIMSKPLITIDLESPLREAVQRMREHRVRRLVVTERGGLSGILTTTDIAKQLSEEGFWREFEQAMVRAGEYGFSRGIGG